VSYARNYAGLERAILERQVALTRAQQVSKERAQLPPAVTAAAAAAAAAPAAATPAPATAPATAAAAAAAAAAGAVGLVVPRSQRACTERQGAQQRGSQLVGAAACSPSKLTRRPRPHSAPCDGQENAPPPGAHAPLGGAHAPFAVAHAPLAVAHAPLGDRLLRLVGAGAVSPPAKLTRRPRRARSTPSAASSAPDAAEAIDEADAWPRRLRRAESDEP
jgi:hypothetical protein